jgi:hypothetical protein
VTVGVNCGEVRIGSCATSTVIEAKPFKIPKREVWEAFRRVNATRERLA